MKVSAYKREQRHLRARRAYWESVYTQNGMRRAPCPMIECYSEEGEIIPNPAFVALAQRKIETPLRNLIPRRSGLQTPVLDWKRVEEML